MFMKKYGTPDLQISGLQIWIHHRQFPDLEDYWDGNWINVTAHCEANGSSVQINGNFIHLSEIAGLMTGVEQMYKEFGGKAELRCMEPELSFSLEAKDHGHIEMTVNITPDNLTQYHNFFFDIDQSFLPKLITDCKAVLEKYPIKGSQ
jgi:hypothetical protein